MNYGNYYCFSGIYLNNVDFGLQCFLAPCFSFLLNMPLKRDDLKEDYKSLLSTPGNSGKKEDFKKRCTWFLEQELVNSCFTLLPFGDIQNEFLKKAKKDKRSFDCLEDVFRNLEKYAQNILVKPWCKDFYTIKVSLY